MREASADSVKADDGTKEPKCWICGQAATTGEHKAKRSDLKSVFGRPSQKKPLFLHTRDNSKRLGSLNAGALKWEKSLCESCNTAVTSPHDLAWEELSHYLRFRVPPILPGMTVRANRVFPYDSRREMLNVHFYFLKMLGCAIVDGKLPFPIADFSNAILKQKAHPHFYLQFGFAPLPGGKAMVGASNPEGLQRVHDGAIGLLVWIYNVNQLRVAMIFAPDADEHWARKRGLWHPRDGSKRLLIGDFDLPDEDTT